MSQLVSEFYILILKVLAWKVDIGILKTFKMWVVFFLLLRFDVKRILWCRSLPYKGICLCKKLTGFEQSSLYPFSLFSSHENSFSKRLNVNLEVPKFCWKISETNKCNLKRRLLGIHSHCSWRVMYECVETWTKTCFFSNVLGLITKCVMSVAKNSFFHSCLLFGLFISCLRINYRLGEDRRCGRRSTLNSLCYKMSKMPLYRAAGWILLLGSFEDMLILNHLHAVGVVISAFIAWLICNLYYFSMDYFECGKVPFLWQAVWCRAKTKTLSEPF